MNLVDLILLAALLLYVFAVFRRGAIVLSADLAVLLGSFLLAFRLYDPVAALLIEHFSVPTTFADALGFLGVLVFAHVLLGLAAERLMRRLPREWHRTVWNRALGVLPAAAHGVILAAALLLLLLALPIAAEAKRDIERSRVGGALIEEAVDVERALAGIFGDAARDTLGVLTVQPQSGGRVALPSTPSNMEVAPEAEQRMLELVNEARAEVDAPPLTMDATIVEVARDHSRDMWRRGYFGHVTPDHIDPFERMETGGVEFAAAGENLALAPTTEIAHRGLMDSPGHRRNILDPSFRRIGIGAIDGGPHGIMFTQNFAD